MNVLDSRDLEEELTALEEPCETWAALTAEEEEARQDEYPGLEAISRYEQLCQLREELSLAGWEYGIQLIPDSDFTEYAQALAEELGAGGRAGWPLRCIDWEQAARELAMDYSIITFDGTDYYWRAA